MKAVVHDRYGPPDVLRIEEIEPPTPAGGELLIRVHATTVTQTDCHMRRAQPFVWRFLLGLRRPKRRVLGVEFAGVVEAVGASVTAFVVEDRVFGLRSGAHAELLCVGEAGLVAHIPEATTFEGAAAVCDGVTQAWKHLAAGGVGAGTRLLVYGASGSCGTAAVQLGRHLGAHVTAVCTAKNMELMRSLGADAVIDYTQEDFTRSGKYYDVILDAVGKHSYFRARRSLAPGDASSRPTASSTSRSRWRPGGSGTRRSWSRARAIRGRRSSSSRRSSRRESTGPSWTARTRSRRWSRRRGTSRAGRRRVTSS